MEEENARIWKSQILILFSISNKTHAYLGPLYDANAKAERLKELFPSYHRTKPIVCSKQPIDLNYISVSLRVFRSAPSTKNNQGYIALLDKVESKKATI